MLRALAGLLVVAALKLLALFPPNVLVALGTPLLPFYILFKTRTTQRLKNLPNPVSPSAYYRMRLRLAALSLRHLTGYEQDVPIHVEGENVYTDALHDGRPVVLLGWHQGPVELLHRIPVIPSEERPFYVLTGKGFSPMLTKLLQKGRRQDGKQSIEPKDQVAALRSWARRSGVIAVMIDQVPGKPRDWFSLWHGAVEIPIPQNLLDWMRERGAIFIAVSVLLENDEEVSFRYDPVTPDLRGLKTLIEKAVSKNPGQYNWSYPKIRVRGKREENLQ